MEIVLLFLERKSVNTLYFIKYTSLIVVFFFKFEKRKLHKFAIRHVTLCPSNRQGVRACISCHFVEREINTGNSTV